MDPNKNQSFAASAEAQLSALRRNLLIVAQTGAASDLAVPLQELARLSSHARDHGQTVVERLCAECSEAIAHFGIGDKITPGAIHTALDVLARIEAVLWSEPMRSGEFIDEIDRFVDESFDEIAPSLARGRDEPSAECEDFEIDDETLEIFRLEADELLANIVSNISVLSDSPGDQSALWEIRRSSHTLKGAAGIVGLTEASRTAHRVEDLLDKMVEMKCEAGPEILALLNSSAGQLTAMIDSREPDGSLDLEAMFAAVLPRLSEAPAVIDKVKSEAPSGPERVAPDRSAADRVAPTPIVRVSLDRLDDLIKLSHSLIINRSAVAQRLADVGSSTGIPNGSHLGSLVAAQKELTDELLAKLLKIRMVRFATLETRLSRNVHVTCVDEGKKAVLELTNGEVEIDTQMIDAMVEPLLHLLKNAVVHGVEEPETRRLIGKPERGRIAVEVNSDRENLLVSVTDDGRGIVTARLKEKAVAAGILDQTQADELTDRDAIELIFDRGLTTAERIDLNAGRGVGMSIVKESIESRGGSILVKTEPGRGTTFTMIMPMALPRAELKPRAARADAETQPSPLILIVDDSAVIRRQTGQLAEQAGCRVLTANNGADALELLLNGEWEPDLILSDIEMPQIDGWGLLEYVRTDSNFGHIPVVIVSSLDADEHRQRALDLGASDYINKPLSGGDLARIVTDVLKSTVSEPAVLTA